MLFRCPHVHLCAVWTKSRSSKRIQLEILSTFLSLPVEEAGWGLKLQWTSRQFQGHLTSRCAMQISSLCILICIAGKTQWKHFTPVSSNYWMRYRLKTHWKIATVWSYLQVNKTALQLCKVTLQTPEGSPCAGTSAGAARLGAGRGRGQELGPGSSGCRLRLPEEAAGAARCGHQTGGSSFFSFFLNSHLSLGSLWAEPNKEMMTQGSRVSEPQPRIIK